MSARSITDQGGHAPVTGDRYLLFGGSQQTPKGGLGDLLDTFTSEEAARRAFRDVRLRLTSPTSWAQLAVVDDRNGLKPMCWFGIGAEPVRGHPAPGPSPTESRAERAAPERNFPLPNRRQAPVLACWLLAFLLLTDIAGPLFPSSERNVVFGIVASLLTGLAATGLWTMRRWGSVATLVVATVTLLSDARVIATGTTELIKVWATAAVVTCALIIVLLTGVAKVARR